MLRWLAKIVVEKIVSFVLFLLAIGLIILVWRYHQEVVQFWRGLVASAHSVLLFLGGIALWLVVASLLPWVTFFLVRWVEKAENNVPAIALLVFWAALDGGLAWWLAGAGDWPRVAQWSAGGLAFCLGGLYNLIAANQIASRRL